jgi:hypothetical protein
LRTTAEVVGSTLNLSIALEGSDGQSLSGALVKLTDPAGAVSLVGYDSRKNAYTLSAPALNGEYTVQADSVRMGQHSLRFPVKVFAAEPDLISVQDGQGNKAEEFKKLEAGSPIRIEWKAVEEAQRYLVELRQAGKVLASSVVKEGNSLVIPANTFQAVQTGSPATLQVTASTQSGDLGFSAGYLSNTSTQGASYTFQVVP